MTNDELDQAINTAHNLLRGTAANSKLHATINEHFQSLLEIQGKRALAEPEPTPPNDTT